MISCIRTFLRPTSASAQLCKIIDYKLSHEEFINIKQRENKKLRLRIKKKSTINFARIDRFLATLTIELSLMRYYRLPPKRLRSFSRITVEIYAGKSSIC